MLRIFKNVWFQLGWQIPGSPVKSFTIIFLVCLCLALFWVIGMWLTPTSHYQLMESTLPVRLAWEFQAPDIIVDPPVIGADGTVYVEVGDNLIQVLDSLSGQVKWQHEVHQKTRGFILPYDNLAVITTSKDSVLQAFNSYNGTLAWEISLKDFTKSRSILSPPSVNNLFADSKRIYVGVSLSRGTDVLAFEPTTGDLLWQAPSKLSERKLVPYIIFGSQEEIVVDTSGNLIILDKETGQILQWEESSLIKSYRPPSHHLGTLYTSGEVVRAIDIKTLEEKWHFTPECPGPFEELVHSPPMIVDKVAYLLTTCRFAYALNADTGQLLWRYEDSSEHSMESFVVFQGNGYLLTKDGTLHALDLTNGQELGRMEVKPQSVNQANAPYLVASQSLLLVRYGTDQLFAFR